MAKTTAKKNKLYKPIPMGADPNKDFVIGYMDLTDFECEVGMASGGNTIYPSPEDVLANRSCAVECGIVEVKVEATRVIQERSDDF